MWITQERQSKMRTLSLVNTDCDASRDLYRTRTKYYLQLCPHTTVTYNSLLTCLLIIWTRKTPTKFNWYVMNIDLQNTGKCLQLPLKITNKGIKIAHSPNSHPHPPHNLYKYTVITAERVLSSKRVQNTLPGSWEMRQSTVPSRGYSFLFIHSSLCCFFGKISLWKTSSISMELT